MKQFLFKQSALLGKGKAGHKNSAGQIYHVGVHSVSDEHQQDATFLHFKKHGLIEPYVAKKQEKLKAAESDLAKVSQGQSEGVTAPDAEVGGDNEIDPDAEVGGDDEPKQNKSHGKGRRK